MNEPKNMNDSNTTLNNKRKSMKVSYKKDKECQGCLINVMYNPLCAIRDLATTNCPCQKCIIKMVCCDGCPEYSHFFKLNQIK